MDSDIVYCISCGSRELKDFGALIKMGGLFPLPNQGHVFQCRKCRILFRHPYLSEAQLRVAYESVLDHSWQYRSKRHDYVASRKLIEKELSEGAILDIGCHRGDFLASLSTTYEKYGLDPSINVAEIVRERNITLLEGFIDALENRSVKFDVITMFDVIEHLTNPLKELRIIRRALVSGGMLLVSTANTDALPWRLMRRDYWYYFPEHVAFFNPAWFHWAAGELGFTVSSISKFSHPGVSYSHRTLEFLGCLRFIAFSNLSRVFELIVGHPVLRRYRKPAETRHWPDHMLVALKKAESFSQH